MQGNIGAEREETQSDWCTRQEEQQSMVNGIAHNNNVKGRAKGPAGHRAWQGTEYGEGQVKWQNRVD